MRNGVNLIKLKRLLFFSLFIYINCTLGFSQKQKAQFDPTFDDRTPHYGFSIGLNTMDFSIGRKAYVAPNNISPGDSMYADVSTMIPGFQVNIVTDFRLSEYFIVRFLPGLIFGQRNINYTVNGRIVNTQKIESSYLDFPLLIKYKSQRVNNYRPYLIGGISVRYDMAARKSYDSKSNQYILLKPLDFFYEMGVGIDYYQPYFKFSTELKLSVGVRNVIFRPQANESHPEYSDAITKLTSQVLMFSIYFE